MKKLLNKTWFIWLLLIIIWNFGWPNASPILDVAIAIVLSITISIYKNKK